MTLAALLFSTVSAAVPGPTAAARGPFELVLTAPVETTLVRDDVRSPVVVWPEMFDAAKKTVDIAEFYIAHKPGEALQPILEHLTRAGKRGVKIRFMLEKKMEKNYQAELELLKKIPNLEVREIDWGKVTKGQGILHAKYFVVDETSAYVGSQNFDWRSLSHIHELGLKVTVPRIVSEIEAIFARDWEAAGTGEEKALNQERPKSERSEPAYLVASPYPFNPPHVGDSEKELQDLIGEAKESIEVQLLDYCPLDFPKKRFYPPIDNALRDAAARGVKVKIMVSHCNTDMPCVQHLKSLSLLPNVAVKIVTLPEAKSGFIPFARVVHSKYMVVDRKTLWLGTSNWSGGYMDNSRNLELVLHDAALAGTAASIHQQLWESPYAEAIDVMKAYPKPKRG